MSIKSTTPKPIVSVSQLERVCRMYRTNAQARRALGIGLKSFKAACDKYGVIPPTDRLACRTGPKKKSIDKE